MSDLENEADGRKILLLMEGEGDLRTLGEVIDLWQEFSTDYAASWLIVDELMFGCFAGWLASQLLSARAKLRRESRGTPE